MRRDGRKSHLLVWRSTSAAWVHGRYAASTAHHAFCTLLLIGEGLYCKSRDYLGYLSHQEYQPNALAQDLIGPVTIRSTQSVRDIYKLFTSLSLL